MPGAELTRNKSTFQRFHDAMSTGDMDVISRTIAEDDKVVGRTTVTGTHRGEHMGIAPTGKRIAYDEIFIFRFAGRRIAETWGVVDVYGQLRQLGAVPAAT